MLKIKSVLDLVGNPLFIESASIWSWQKSGNTVSLSLLPMSHDLVRWVAQTDTKVETVAGSLARVFIHAQEQLWYRRKGLQERWRVEPERRRVSRARKGDGRLGLWGASGLEKTCRIG